MRIDGIDALIMLGTLLALIAWAHLGGVSEVLHAFDAYVIAGR